MLMSDIVQHSSDEPDPCLMQSIVYQRIEFAVVIAAACHVIIQMPSPEVEVTAKRIRAVQTHAWAGMWVAKPPHVPPVLPHADCVQCQSPEQYGARRLHSLRAASSASAAAAVAATAAVTASRSSFSDCARFTNTCRPHKRNVRRRYSRQCHNQRETLSFNQLQK